MANTATIDNAVQMNYLKAYIEPMQADRAIAPFTAGGKPGFRRRDIKRIDGFIQAITNN